MPEEVKFLESIVKALVDNPNEVHIERTTDNMGVLLILSVNPQDMGKVIGKQGANAKAVRTLLRAVGVKNHAYVNLKIKDPRQEAANAEDVNLSDL